MHISPTKSSNANGADPAATTPMITLGMDENNNSESIPLSEFLEVCCHALGPSRSGKTNWLTFLKRQLLSSHVPFMTFDTEGGSHQNDLMFLARHPDLAVENRVVEINLSDPENSPGLVGINPLARFAHSPSLAVQVDSLLDVVASVWAEESRSTPQLRRFMRNFFFMLIENCLSFQEMKFLLASGRSDVRRRLALRSENERAKAEVLALDSMTPSKQDDKLNSSMNRVAEFTDSEILQAVLGRTQDVLDIKDVIENQRTVLVNLSQEGGQMSEDSARLVACLLISMVVAYALTRPEDEARDKPYLILCDEFPAYVTPRMAKALDQLLKRKVVFIFLNQHLNQIQDEWLYHSILQNARLKLVFALNDPDDLQVMERYLFPGELDLHRVKHTTFVDQEAVQHFYSLGELHHMNEVLIHRQHRGHFIMKLGSDSPVFLRVPLVKPEQVDQEEIAHLRSILKNLSPRLYWPLTRSLEHVRSRQGQLQAQETEEDPSTFYDTKQMRPRR